jgi:predicted peroxiredoxin
LRDAKFGNTGISRSDAHRPEANRMANKKMVIIATHGDEDPERATIPFVMANAALASETDASVILQTTGVNLAVKGYAKHVRAEAFPPLTDLVKDFMDMGGRLLVCAPCIKSRGIAEDELIDGAKIAAAGTVVSETTSADATLVY